jgi:hypothetical protein
MRTSEVNKPFAFERINTVKHDSSDGSHGTEDFNSTIILRRCLASERLPLSHPVLCFQSNEMPVQDLKKPCSIFTGNLSHQPKMGQLPILKTRSKSSLSRTTKSHVHAYDAKWHGMLSDCMSISTRLTESDL